MLKKTLTYDNIDGNTVTKDFYFNLTKAELLKMQLSEDEGFKEHLERIIKTGKGKDIIEAFEQILRLAYGERSENGDFLKSTAAFDAFMATEAYSNLFFELVTDAKKSAEFVNAIIPSGMAEEVQKVQTRQVQDIKPHEVSLNSEPNPNNMTESELRVALGSPSATLTNGLTDAEIMGMSPLELTKQPREVLVRAFQLKNN